MSINNLPNDLTDVPTITKPLPSTLAFRTMGVISIGVVASEATPTYDCVLDKLHNTIFRQHINENLTQTFHNVGLVHISIDTS